MVTPTNAARQLDNAFRQRRTQEPRRIVGLFGDGFPEALLRAAGFGVDWLNMPGPSAPETGEVASFIEPFVDPHVRHFLHRLAAGDYNSLAAIVFSRDDSTALVAYQYALELRRRGLVATAPHLILWNLVHSPGPAVARFNATQAGRLWHALDVPAPASTELSDAVADARRRADALKSLAQAQCADRPRISGEAAMRWRTAGRWLPPRRHAQLVEAALADARPSPRTRQRLGLVGGRVEAPEVYRRIEAAGALVCDLTPLVAGWPVPLPEKGPGDATIEAQLDAASADSACPRVVPPEAFSDALLAGLAKARCDAVICLLPPDDEVFGWETPYLAERLGSTGVPLIDLGFVAAAPDEATLGRISKQLSGTLGTGAQA